MALTSVAVVVSFCEGNLDSLSSMLSGLHVERVTLYSKCGTEAWVDPDELGLGEPRSEVRVVTLPNVGSCDYAYSHHAEAATAADADEGVQPAEVTLFVKDTDVVHQVGRLRDIADVVREAAQDGFACGQQPTTRVSAWHASHELLGFNMTEYMGPDHVLHREGFASPLGSMREWLASLAAAAAGWPRAAELLDAPLWPVCYGGVFAASSAALRRVPHAFWQAHAASLGRGAQIAEAHYAERTWAALLSQPLNRSEAEAIAASAECAFSEVSSGYVGALVSCRR